MMADKDSASVLLGIIDGSGTGREMSELRLPFLSSGARLGHLGEADRLDLTDGGIYRLQRPAIGSVQDLRRRSNRYSRIIRAKMPAQDLECLRALGLEHLLDFRWQLRSAIGIAARARCEL